MSNEMDIFHPHAGRRPEPVMPCACRKGGCGGPAPRTPPPSYGEVWVNGVEIAHEAIAREMQHHPAPDADTAWTQAARALAVRELLLQEARRLGVEGAPEPDEAGRTESGEDALVAALLDQEIKPATPEEAACRRYYDANKVRFRTPDLFEASHILIEPEGTDEAAWAAAEKQAAAIAGELGDDPVAFAEAARTLSACPSSLQDGSLGQVRRGDLAPQLQEALEALEPGKSARAPVRSRFGWHVVHLARRIEGHTLPFEAVREKIADMLAARSWAAAATRYVATLAGHGNLKGVSLPGPEL